MRAEDLAEQVASDLSAVHRSGDLGVSIQDGAGAAVMPVQLKIQRKYREQPLEPLHVTARGSLLQTRKVERSQDHER